MMDTEKRKRELFEEARRLESIIPDAEDKLKQLKKRRNTINLILHRLKDTERKGELLEEMKHIEATISNMRNELWRLKRKWRKSINPALHHLLKPVILERDGHRCRACGSITDLELVRLYGGALFHLVPIEKAYAEENMFILCRRCHMILEGAQWTRRMRLRRAELAPSVKKKVDSLRKEKVKLWMELRRSKRKVRER